jgi:hypothetical protein
VQWVDILWNSAGANALELRGPVSVGVRVNDNYNEYDISFVAYMF